MKFVQHLKESNRKVCSSQYDTSYFTVHLHVDILIGSNYFVFHFQKAQNQDKSQREKPTSQSLTEKHNEKDEDEHLLQEFEDEMADLSVPTDKIDEIKEEMQREFDNIINEVWRPWRTFYSISFLFFSKNRSWYSDSIVLFFFHCFCLCCRHSRNWRQRV